MNVPARRPNGTMMPGSVLNPGGRPRNAIEELREKYLHRLPEFFDGVIQLTKSSNENIRLQAYRELLDRLIGRPMQSADVSVTKFDAGVAYLEALRRASQRAHAVPGETVIDDGDRDGAASPTEIQ